MTVQTQTWALSGGLDLVSPALNISAGRAIVAQNYEASLSGGYRRIDGYETFDGSTTAVPVSGSGGILGVWEYNDDVYAFRDNVAGTACVMHKATTGGWQVVPTPALAPSGRFEFVNHNFFGSSSTEKMYGVDGKNQGFEFDGTTFTQISTGMALDVPTHIAVHKNHLFFSFAGGSVQHSGISDPTNWTLGTGAGELGLGTEITNLDTLRGNALVICGETKVSILYGTSSLNWDIKTFSTDLGVMANTTDVIDSGLVWFNGRNVTYLHTTQAFGDFNTASLSTLITPYIESRKERVVGATVNKSKNQYRLFFSDKSVACATIVNNEVVGWTSWLIEHEPTALTEGYTGCIDGTVLKMDCGTSFDGAKIESFLRLPFTTLSSPNRRKRFRRVFLELEAGSEATLKMVADYDYGLAASTISNEAVIYGSGGLWDVSSWGNFTWSSTIVSRAETGLNGSGYNFGMLLYHSSTTDPSFTIQGVTVNYSIRGLIR